MTYQRDPDGRREPAYLDQDASIGWAPIVLGVAFIALLAFLMFGPSIGPDRPAISQRSELPNTAPGAPPIPTPAPPKPQ
jgi:hypothetical protein